jgi:transposase
MMGSKERAFAPLIDVALEQLVPADHFYRYLDKSLDLSFVRELVAPFYATGGRPSIDPLVFFKLPLIMFLQGSRSERQLVRTAADRLSLRWSLGYDLQQDLPDHSSLTRIRARYGIATFRRFFEHIVEQCQKAGLVGGKELYFDGAQVEANADSDAMQPRFYVEAMQAHWAALFPEQAPPVPPEAEAGEHNAGAATSGGVLHLSRQPPPTDQTPAPNTRTASQDWITRLGRPATREANRAYQRIADLRVSTTDPDAPLMHKKGGGGSHLGYHTHYAVDGGKARSILQALVTPSEVQDNQPLLDLLWRVMVRWRLRPKQVTGDTRTAPLENLKAIEDAGIRAYIPLHNFEDSRGVFGKQRFVYDAAADQYRCPQGVILPFRKHDYTQQVYIYQAEAATCNSCALRAQCTTSDLGRQVKRNFDEAYQERVRAYENTSAYQKALAKRRVWGGRCSGRPSSGTAWGGSAYGAWKRSIARAC